MTPPTRRTPATIPDSPGAGGASPPALELTLAPIGLEAFLADHWERRPLVLQRDEPGRFDGILSAADAERLACATGIRVPAFRLVRDGTQLPLPGYTEDIPWRPGTFAGIARADRVAEEFAAGATLVLQALQLHWEPAALYCRALEKALGFPVQANAYLTPAAAQGFALHHDTHDVLVLQVSGRKRWRVHRPVLELPLKSQRWSPALGDPGEPVHDLVLGPGDTLYLPRGWPHEAETSEEDSLHVTVGLHPPTRLDALRAALEACGDDVEFRRSVGPDGVLPRDLLDRLAARLDASEVARRGRRRFVAGRRPVLGDQMAQLRALENLGPGDSFARRETVIADLEADAGAVTLRFEGKQVAFPARAREEVEAIHASSGPLSVGELPGRLDTAGRLVLVRRLVREGYARLTAV